VPEPTPSRDDLLRIARSGDVARLSAAIRPRVSLPAIQGALDELLHSTAGLEDARARARVLETLVDAMPHWMAAEAGPDGQALLAAAWEIGSAGDWAAAWSRAHRAALRRVTGIPPGDPTRLAGLGALAGALGMWLGPPPEAWYAGSEAIPGLYAALLRLVASLSAMQDGYWQARALASLSLLAEAAYALRDAQKAERYLERVAADLAEQPGDQARVDRLGLVLGQVTAELPPGSAFLDWMAPPRADLDEAGPAEEVRRRSRPRGERTFRGGGSRGPGGAPAPSRRRGADGTEKGIPLEEARAEESPGPDEGGGEELELDWSAKGESGPSLSMSEKGLEESQPGAADQPAEPPPRYADYTFFADADGRPGLAVAARQALQAEQWYHLEIAVRVKPGGIPVEAGQRREIREPRQAGPVTLMVTAEGDGFDIDEPVRTLTLPPLGDSTQNALFKVRPVRESTHPDARAEIRVRLYFQFNLLEVAVIHAEVVGKFDDPSRSQLGLEQPISFSQERLEHQLLDLDNIQPRAMNVDITRRGGEFLFHFAFYNQAEQKLVFTAPARLTPADLEDQLVSIRNIWYDIAMSPAFTQGLQGDADEFRAQVRRLAQAGRRLWVMLFKRERGSALYQVGDWLEAHPLARDGIIQISLREDAAEFVFPWALVYDGAIPRKAYELPDLEGFWGVRYCIEQQLPNVVKADDQPLLLQAQLQMGFMLWDQFRNVEDQKQLMQQLVQRSAGRLEVSTPPINDADACYDLMAQGDAQFLYFYTHGYTRHRQADIGVGSDLDAFLARYEALAADSPVRETYKLLYEAIKKGQFEPDRSWIELTYGKLYLDELYDSVDELPGTPFVMLNMCESAQLTPSLSDSFFHFFLNRGARAVIGTECPMTVEFAHPFAARFLDDVFSGRPVGDALLDARRHFLKLNNPLGLAYTLFGQATVAFEPPRLAAPVAGEG
jgi:hypothetical protein